MKIEIKVPATSANIGPGFDTSGLAINLYNEYTFDFNQTDIQFTDDQYEFKTSLTLDTFFDVLEQFDIEKPLGVHLHTISNIPVARGLGSSSACIVAGLLAANHYGKLKLDKKKLCQIATNFEGHPDNVVSAIMGNLNISLLDSSFHNIEIKMHDELALIAIIPHHEVKTSDARNILPQFYSLEDAVFNLSRMAFVKEAFENKDIALLKLVTQDKLHEKYRQTLIEDYNIYHELFKNENIITSWVSGAGPTMMLLVDIKTKDEVTQYLTANLANKSDIINCQIDSKGAIIK